MSSEQSTTSSSSRLSQFGLYRTIDARTEEFLKLSKKKQIRQGCACAVISTAITITIVITVFLIYEYNGYSDLNTENELSKTSNITKYARMQKSSREGNNGKLNKKKHIISPSTINLLNILVKALNHTHNLEKQEKVKNTSTIDKHVATDIPLQRNVFSDIKNWIRIPYLRMLAPEHKAPSIFYYRNPKPNARLATNTRKPSIYTWADLPKASDEVLEQSPMSSIKKYDQNFSIIRETTTVLPQNDTQCSGNKGQKNECKCSKLTVFICKLLSNIQELFPGVILNATLCSDIVISKPSITLNIITNIEKIENKTAKIKNATEVSQVETGKYVVTADMYKEYQKYLLINTNKTARGNKIERKYNSQTNITKMPLETQSQSLIHTTTNNPGYTTTVIKPYIVTSELAGYLKYFIKSSTTATKRDHSVRPNKPSEKIQVTKRIDKYIITTDLNKEYLEYLLTDRNKSTNALKSQKKYKNSGEIQETKTLELTNIPRKYLGTEDMNKKYQKHLVTNINKSTNLRKSKYQNSVRKTTSTILSNNLQSVINTTKRIIKLPEYTTTTLRPYIVAPELDFTPITTTTSKPATTIKQHKLKPNVNIEKIKDGSINSTEIKTQKGTSAAAVLTMKYHNIIDQNLDNKALDGMIKTTEITTQKVTSTASTTTKHHNIENLHIKKVLDEMMGTTVITTQRVTSISEHHKNYQKLDTEKALERMITSTEITTQNGTSTAATTTKDHKIYQNLDIEKVLEETIRSTEITTQKGIPIDASKTNCQEIKQNFDIEKELEEANRRTRKPSKTATIAKYFKDDAYAENEPFKDIKFARFDSFAANSNKHILLPSYKDINFELFPVYKRHNTNRPNFNTKSESLVNTNPQMGNDFTEIMYRNKKDDYISTSNEMISNLPSKNYSKITNELPIKSSSINEDTSPVDWIYQINMMNDKIKETIEENLDDKYKESNTNLQKSTKTENEILPKTFSSADKHAIWTYSIDNDYLETTTKMISDNELKRYETTKQSIVENIPLNRKLSQFNANKQTVSISRLYDTNQSLLKYRNKTIESKRNRTDKQNIKLLSDSENSTLFENKIQEMLMSLRDTSSIENKKADITMKYVIPNESVTDDTEYNPSSMLPRSRPSYLEINRNFLNIGEDQDYKINYKQKRQDYDYLYDIFV